MIIISKDEKKLVDIGTSEYYYAFYSTVLIRCNKRKEDIPKALSFFETGKCLCSDALDTARQVNIIRDILSNYKPDQMVYDYNNPNNANPLLDDLSYVVTSCANVFLTNDGKDLLFEIVSILTYGYYLKSDIFIKGE